MPVRPGALRWAELLARHSGTAVAALGLVVLVGWFADIAFLRSVIPGFATMKANTALAFVALGTASWLAVRDRAPRLRLGATATVLVLGGATILQYVLGISLGIDTLLVADPDSALTPYPGRMSPVTAVSFVIAGTAMLAHPHAVVGRWHVRHVAATGVLAFALVAVGGYVYGTRAFFGASHFTTGMAVHTAAGFMVWAASVLAADPEHGPAALLADHSATGVIARRLVPVAFLVPAGLGLLAAIGLRMQWYDAPFALAALSISIPLVFIALLFLSLRVSRAFEAERDAAEREHRLAQMRHLEEQNRFKADFLNRAAHELATPLTPIVLRLRSLERFCEAHGGPAEQQGLATLRRNVDRLRGIIDDLVEASRVDAHVADLRPAALDLGRLVRALAPDLQARAEGRGLTFSAQIDDIRATGDAHATREVIERLVENAIKFTPEGGTVRLRVRDDDGPLCEVVDTGRGLAPGAEERLFQTFTQDHDPAEVTGPGTGMGLYLCRLLIDAQGGRIGLHSAGLGKGATFWFRLPS